MWARDFEISFALWLGMSPFILRYQEAGAGTGNWVNDFACSGALMLLAALSYHRRLRRAHLLELPIGAWLFLYGWFQGRPEATPMSQNHILVGLLILLFAIIPSNTSEPPPSWAVQSPRRGAP